MYRLMTQNTLLRHKPFLVVRVGPWACTVHVVALPCLRLHPYLSHVEHVRCVCEDVSMINENVAAALLRKGSLPLNNAVPLL